MGVFTHKAEHVKTIELKLEVSITRKYAEKAPWAEPKKAPIKVASVTSRRGFLSDIFW